MESRTRRKTSLSLLNLLLRGIVVTALLAGAVPTTWADDGKTGFAGGPTTVAALGIGGEATFKPDGSFAVAVPGELNWSSLGSVDASRVSVQYSGQGGTSDGRSTHSSPSPASGDVVQTLEALLLSRSDNCLVSADSSPCHDPPTETPPASIWNPAPSTWSARRSRSAG
jgi:hypothetical protein